MKNIAVIFGSRSAEHDVSIITAQLAIIEPLKLISEYQPIPVYIAKDGNWYSEKGMTEVGFFTSDNFEERIKKANPLSISFNNGLELSGSGFKSKRVKIDMAFPATHGTYGEDGSLMGVLRMANIPFVGCDLQASAIAMDKGLTKTVVIKAGLGSNKYKIYSGNEYLGDTESALAELSKMTFPLFVKPLHLGSSIAISKVKNKEQLKNGIELALHYDSGIIVEEAVPNLIEVTVPIMGNEEPIPALVEESLNKDADFFNYDVKYLQGGKKDKSGVGVKGKSGVYSNLPAAIPKDLYKKCEEVAIAAYRAIGASGIARVDLLINSKTKEVYVNEINPLPGSLYAHNWKQAGVSGVELVEKLIYFAIKRYDKQKRHETVFKTSFLKQF